MTKSEIKTEKEEFKLPNKIILVKPVIRETTMNPKNHSGNWMYDNGRIAITPRVSPENGQIVNPLTKEEQEWFETSKDAKVDGYDFKLGDLAANKRTDNFWEEFNVQIIKKTRGPIKEDEVLMTLDLSNPSDYLKYAVLRSNDAPGGPVAVGADRAYARASTRIVLVEKNAEFNRTVEDIDKMEEANKFFYQINNSVQEMTNFLRIYNLENHVNADIPTDASSAWCKQEINKLIVSDVNKFLSVIKNKDSYKDKIFVITALKNELIRLGKGGAFFTIDGDFLGEDMSEVIGYLNKLEHQELKLQIKAKLGK